jgi:hypothetical protein
LVRSFQKNFVPSISPPRRHSQHPEWPHIDRTSFRADDRCSTASIRLRRNGEACFGVTEINRWIAVTFDRNRLLPRGSCEEFALKHQQFDVHGAASRAAGVPEAAEILVVRNRKLTRRKHCVETVIFAIRLVAAQRVPALDGCELEKSVWTSERANAGWN